MPFSTHKVSSASIAPQFDVSDVVRLRQRVGHAATSLKIIGFMSALYLYGFMNSYVGYLAALPFGLFVPGIANSTAKWLRAGSRRAATIAAVWWMIWFGFSSYACSKFLTEVISGYYITGALMMFLPLALLAWGLVGFTRYRIPDPTGAKLADLRARPWEECLRVRLRPKFLNKKSLSAYIALAMSPIIFLWFRISTSLTDPELPPFNISDGAVTGNYVGIYTVKLASTFVFFYISVRIYRYARREAMLPGSALVKKDPRPIMLYLRSFHDDSNINLWARTTNGRILPERIVRISFEEVMTDHLWRYGPVLAIGELQVSSETALLGAARDYAIYISWQDKVTELMKQASMIVTLAGQTPGLLWEINTITSLGFLSKFVLVFPPIDKKKLKQRWCFIERNVPVLNLPHEIDLSRVRAVIFPEGCATMVYGNQRSDWTYEAVLDQAALTILVSPPPIEKISRAQQLLGTIRSEVGILVKTALLILFMALALVFLMLIDASIDSYRQINQI